MVPVNGSIILFLTRFNFPTNNTCLTDRMILTRASFVTFLEQWCYLSFFPIGRQSSFVQVFLKNTVKGPVMTITNSLSNLEWKPSGPHDLLGFRATRRLRTSYSYFSKPFNPLPLDTSNGAILSQAYFQKGYVLVSAK
jgi:hypothetical protein